MPPTEVLSSKLRYQEAVTLIQEDIYKGKYLVNERLPGLKELSKSLQMNMPSVRRALKELQEDGVVNIRHGSGTLLR
jgi:DNA-binding GntR family transcriptional regulator